MRPVDLLRGGVAERARRVGEAAHRRQHAPHVGMRDDRRHAIAVVTWRVALAALAGERKRVLKGAFGDCDALERDGQARAVHHGKHTGEPTMFLAEQPAARAATVAEDHRTGRARVDAELVLEARAAHVIARASGRIFGTRNREMPRVPFGASGNRARTRWTMLSVRSCSP